MSDELNPGQEGGQENPYEFMGAESAETAQQRWQEIRQQAENAKTYEQQLQEYKDRIKPANEFVAKLNNYFTEGRSPQEVEQFIEVQRLDFEKEDPAGLIKRNMRLRNPNLTAEDAELLFKQKYGSPNEDDYENGKQDPKYIEAVRLRDALIRQDSFEAVESLKKLKADMTAPQQDAKSAMDAGRARALQAHKAIVDQIPSDLEIDFSFDDKKAIGGAYDFKWKPSLTAEEEKLFRQQTAQFMASAGQMPDAESKAKAEQFFRAIVQRAKVEDFTKAVLADFYAGVVQSMTAQKRLNVNNPNNRNPVQGRSPKKANPPRRGFA